MALLHEWSRTRSVGTLKRVKNKRTQQQYRVRNWQEYNAALVNRGSLTIWLDEAALSGWLEASIAQLSGDIGYDQRSYYKLLGKREEKQGQELQVASIEAWLKPRCHATNGSSEKN